MPTIGRRSKVGMSFVSKRVSSDIVGSGGRWMDIRLFACRCRFDFAGGMVTGGWAGWEAGEQKVAVVGVQRGRSDESFPGVTANSKRLDAGMV